MKIKIYILVALITLLMPSISNAQAGWSEATRLFDLRVFAGRSVVGQTIDTEVSVECPEAVTGFQRESFVVDIENPLFAETYAILLTAQTTGRLVQVYRTGECFNDRNAIINGARLRNLAE